jgi:hypothetical protein
VFANLGYIDGPPGTVAFEAIALIRDCLALAEKFLVRDETLRPHSDKFLKLAVQLLGPNSPVGRPIRDFGLVLLDLFNQEIADPYQDVRLRRNRVEELFELLVDASGGMALATLRAGRPLAHVVRITLAAAT